MILGDNTYYVSSSTTNDCPKQCHPLSYYITHAATYFTSNATFIFMEGEHLLDSKGLVQVVINNVDNLTLRGERGHSNTDTIIKCSSNTSGLIFNNGNIITIYDITITGCGQQYIPPLLLINIASIYIHHITLNSNTYYYSMYDYGGALYIHCGIDTHITITDSTISNNTVAFGGGLLISAVAGTHNNVTITNSTFINNIIGIIGGGLYIGLADTYSTVAITDSKFANNAVGTGGGLFIYSTIYTHSSITITDSIFTNNTVGGDGGGLYLYSVNYTDIHNNITITDSIISNNTCKGVGGGLYIVSPYTNTNINVHITNSMITNNNRNGLLLQCLTCKLMLSQVIVSNNNGSGIEAVHVTVIFTEGHSIVANNSSPTDGGGIYLVTDAYLTTSNGGHVSFINNTAYRYGGAIYSPYNDYALLRYSAYTYLDVQCTVYNLSATFSNNSAGTAGDLLYGGTFIFCQNGPYNIIHCPNVPDIIKNASSVHPLSPVSSDPLMICPCVNDTVNCTITSLDRELYPGQILNISLVTVGLCGGVSPGAVVVKHDKKINLISSATSTDYTSTTCTTLNYTVKVTNYISNSAITINAGNGAIYDIRPINVHLSIIPCPLGLILNATLGNCVCDYGITQIPGVSCNVSWMPYPIQRSGNNWISHQYDDYNCTIAHTGCPFDYCNILPVNFALNQSDLQCNYNRSGILCGRCVQGLSLMIGSNRCSNCTDTTLVSVSIVILAAVAGIVLVILLMVLNLTVSVGSINGLLFYANIVKLNESVFFSQGNIPVVTQFISWCNLDIGFEYCFIDGLDGYVKTWLQFVFPLYVWLLVIVIIVGCRYSGRLSHLCGRNAVPVLATLILMSFNKLSRTVTNALMMNTLQCGEHKWNVWNVDGNIPYLSGKHIALFTVSLLFLITGLVYTGLVFSSQWLQRYSGKCCKSTRDPVVRLKPLIDAYTGPFKDKYRFWTGLCLIVRLMLTVVFSFTTTLQVQSKLNNYIIQLMVGAMVIFFVGSRVYKDTRLTVLETVSLVNLICLSVMTILFTESYHDGVSINVIVSVSVSVEILLFVIIVTVHCYLAFKASPNCTLCCKTHAASEDELHLIADNIEKESSACVITRSHREELIFDFYLTKEHP